MYTSNFIGNIVNTSLRQLGASSIEEIRNGILYIAKFELQEGIQLAYVFNITKRQRYFLQRVEPYPISYGYFDSADDIVTFIKKDLEKFKNAQKSHHFKQFLEISKVFHQSSLELEQLFLERNVSHAAMDGLETSAKDLLNTLQQAYATCPKIE